MARLPIKTKTLKQIFALSGNVCAYSNCEHELFNGDVFVAQLCHLYPANSNWPRYDEHRTDEENRHFSNLLVLCYRHHKIIDNPETPYSIEELLEMKRLHEKKYQQSPLLLSHSKIAKIQQQIETYWTDIVDIFHVENQAHGMLRKIRPQLDVWALFDLLDVNLDKLDRIISGMNDIIDGHEITEDVELGYIDWSMRVLGAGNFNGEARHALLQLKVRMAELHLLNSPNNLDVKFKLNETRASLEEAVKSTVIYD